MFRDDDLADIRFDVEVAQDLVSAAMGAKLVVEGMRRERESAVENAQDDFVGGYADLFRLGASMERIDRARLGEVLGELARDVGITIRAAEEERRRLRACAEWREREDARVVKRESGDPGSAATAEIEAALDVPPVNFRADPPRLETDFSVAERPRVSGGHSGEKSSANPARLRTFIDRTSELDLELETQHRRIQRAWNDFEDTCQWVRVRSDSLFHGFRRLLDENQEDRFWIDSIASAFEQAGAGTLISDLALDFAAPDGVTIADQSLLMKLASMAPQDLLTLLLLSPSLKWQLDGMEPTVIFAWWKKMDPATGENSFSARQELLLSEFPTLLGNLEGLPYAARDHANRIALTAAIADYERRIAEFDERVSTSNAGGRSWALGREVPDEALEKLKEQLAALKNIRSSLGAAQPGAPRFLASLTEDTPPLAAISIGDLDTAKSVTYAVPGMSTTTGDMSGWTDASQNLYSLAQSGSAVVAWIGYQTPPAPDLSNLDFGVLDMKYAERGGTRLSASLRGLSAVRQGAPPKLNIVAHSYGTTTAAVALQKDFIHVDNFVMLGSAGLPDKVRTVEDLNADRVYSGHAKNGFPFFEFLKGDQWAWVGRDNSQNHHLNPMDPAFGSRRFGVDSGGDAGRAVTDHSALMGDGNEAGYFDQRTESLRNVVRAINGGKKLTPYEPPETVEDVYVERGTYGR